MKYKEIYKHDMLKYISEEEYNKYGPRTHFYKFSRYIIAYGKFKETNKSEVQVINTSRYKLNIHQICNYIIILIKEKYLQKGSTYFETVYFRCNDTYELREMYYLLYYIVQKLNTLDLLSKLYIHINEDGNLLLTSSKRLITRAEDKITNDHFYLLGY